LILHFRFITIRHNFGTVGANHSFFHLFALSVESTNNSEQTVGHRVLFLTASEARLAICKLM